MGQLYLVRHGKTAMNSPGKGQTHGDRIRGWIDVPLDAVGKQQAQALALAFESKGLDCIHSSDLLRASVTADAIAAKAGLTNHPQVEFRPWNLGDFQGEESADVAPDLADYVLNRPDEAVPNGESFNAFKHRFLGAFGQRLEEVKNGRTVAVVTHYRCVKLAEAWLADGQKDVMSIEPQEFLKADIDPSDVLCIYWDAPSGKWMWDSDDDDFTTEDDQMNRILCELPELTPGTTRQRIQVFPPASDKTYAHPKAKFKLTQEALEGFAADINSRDSVVVDRDHAFAKGIAAPAAAWFVPGTAEVTPEGVFAEVDYTPSAAEQVSNREYRFISPEFSFTTRRNDGKVEKVPHVYAATLTNRPFFDEMAAIAAEEEPDETEIGHEADATSKGGTMDFTALAEAFGLTADASEADVLAAAQAVASENAELKAKLDKAPDEDAVKKLIADAAVGVQAANELAVMKRDAAIKDAIDRNAIVPAQKEHFEGFWAIDPEGTAKLLAEMPDGTMLAPKGAVDARVYDAEGNAITVGDGEGGVAVTADTTPIKVDGIDTPIDENSAKIHAAAMAKLAAAGKATDYTADEYALACEAVMPTLGISR